MLMTMMTLLLLMMVTTMLLTNTYVLAYLLTDLLTHLLTGSRSVVPLAPTQHSQAAADNAYEKADKGQPNICEHSPTNTCSCRWNCIRR